MLKLINVEDACFGTKLCSYLTRKLKQKLEDEFRVGWKNALFDYKNSVYILHQCFEIRYIDVQL